MIRTHIIQCCLPKAEADALNRESGRIYTHTLVAHYRVYRNKRRWLSQYAGMRLNDELTRNEPPLLHAHSKDAAQESFYTACKTAKVNRGDGAKYPHKRKQWRTTIWKTSAIRDRGDHLLLSRAKGLSAVVVRLPDHLLELTTRNVREVRLVYDRCARRYTWHVIIEDGQSPKLVPGPNVVAVDLGEIHPAACTDGQQTLIISARALRAHRQYLAKRLADLQSAQSRTIKGSRCWKRLQRVKTRVRAKQRRRIRDIEHKVSRAVVNFAVERQASTLAVGDVRDVADGKRLHTKSQQKIGTWAHGGCASISVTRPRPKGSSSCSFPSTIPRKPVLTASTDINPRGACIAARSVGFGSTETQWARSISSVVSSMATWGRLRHPQTSSIVDRLSSTSGACVGAPTRASQQWLWLRDHHQRVGRPKKLSRFKRAVECHVETLRRMYVDEWMTIATTARTLRVRKQAVCEALAHWDIPRRRRGPRPVRSEVPDTSTDHRARLHGGNSRRRAQSGDADYTGDGVKDTQAQLDGMAVAILEQDGTFGVHIQRRGEGTPWSATYWAGPKPQSADTPQVVCSDLWEHLATLWDLNILALGQRTVACLGYTMDAMGHGCMITTHAASATSMWFERSAHGINTVDRTAIPEFHARLAVAADFHLQWLR